MDEWQELKDIVLDIIETIVDYIIDLFPRKKEKSK